MKQLTKRFKIFNINYTENEIECINDFKISNIKVFKHIGTIKINGLKNYLQDIGKNDIKSVNIIKNIIKKLCKIIIDTYKTKYIFLLITTSNNNDFIPMWHIDGKTFNRKNEIKLVTTLKGPSTIFIEDEKYYKIYNDIKKKEDTELKQSDNKNIQIIFDKYKNLKKQKFKNAKIIQPNNNQCVIMNVGNYNSPLHIVPNINQERLFISIMPGSEEEIKNLNNESKKFNKEFGHLKK